MVACGSITIVKDSVPDDAQDFEFDPSANLNNDQNFSLDDDADPTLPNQITFDNLLPDTYTIEEVNLPVAFDLTDIVCVGATNSTITFGGDATFDAGDTDVTIELAGGEDVTCTFTNALAAPPEPVGGIVVPVNKLGLLALRLRSGQAPWLGLVGLASLAAVAVALVRRRRA